MSLSFAEKMPRFLKLKVEDDDIGIPPEKLPHIFDRFYQADQSNNRQFEGSGIGLSLVKELVELHGGNITAESVENKGTAFSCYLPLNKKWSSATDVVKSKEPRMISAFIEEGNGSDENKTAEKGEPEVLIVEDQQDVRKYIREKLAGNYKVLEAKNGEEGLAIAKEQMPDIVISDVMMPKMDGFELSQTFKNR